MSLGPCFALLNSSFFSNLNLQIGACKDPLELQKIINEAFSQLSELQAVIEGELAYLLPMQALLTIPTTPSALLTWASNFITNVLTPMLKPYITLTEQIASLTSEVAVVEAAIVAASAKFPGHVINIPGISITCTV